MKKNNMNDNNNDNKNHKKNIILENDKEYEKEYINSPLYPLVRSHKNIYPKNINITDVIGDGNCLFSSISQFIYGNQHMQNIVRKNIYEEALSRMNFIPNITMETENCNIKIYDYIKNIKNDGEYGGDLDISIAYDIYHINIAEYKETYDDDNLINFSFIRYFNEDNNENKDLFFYNHF